MAKVTLGELSLYNFRSYVGQNTFKFEPNGLYLVKGLNKDTGGSSGSGKSSFVLALSYLTGINPIPAKNLQSWATKEPMKVEAVFLSEDKTLRIARGLKLHGNAEVDEKLSSFVGLGQELMSVLTYRPQRKTGFFLSKPDSDKKEFLMSVLGLNRFEEAGGKTADNINALTEKLILATKELEWEQQHLENLRLNEAVKPALPESDITTIQDAIKAKRAKVASAILDNVKGPQETEIEVALKTALLQKDIEYKEELAKWQEDESTRKQLYTQESARSNQLNIQVSKIDQLSKEIEKLNAQIKHVSAGTCPFCKQSFFSQKIIDELTINKNTCLENLASAQALIPEAKAVSNVVSLLAQPFPQTKLAELKEAQADLKRKLGEELTKRQWSVQNYQSEMRAIDSEIKALERELDSISAIFQEKQKRYDEYQKAIIDYQKTIESANRKVASLSTEILKEKEFAKLIGREGFLNSIFEEILEEISNETNLILGNVANTRNCYLNFKLETLTQKGSVKKSIVPVVTINGHESLMTAGLSGGMYSVVDLAVDLAVGNVISRRTGINPGWLVLDEALAGLGPVELESCMEILQQYSQNKTIIVIEHASEVQNLFRDVIEIEYEGGISRIKNA